MRIVFASGNAGKRRELVALLAPLGHRLISQASLGVISVEETGLTFADNALLKARHAAGATGLAALADDSGLEVDALGGAPGVYSARYAGEGASDAENVHKLLGALTGVPATDRTARYRCVLALVLTAADPAPVMAEGVWEGSITTAPRGAGGFGYDPVFRPEGGSRTAAELPAEEKNQCSHRAKALAVLLAQLRA